MSAKIFKGVNKVRRRRRANDSLAKILAEWRYLNPQFNSIENGRKQNLKPAAKGSKKGCMRGKGGPENYVCKYRGVRQRTWGRWVAEIRMPVNCIKPSRVNTSKNRLWLGTFDSALKAALAYDLAARTMYCSSARVNFSENEQELPALTPESTTTSGHFEISLAEEQKLDTSEFCEMKMGETVKEVKDVKCRPIIHNKSMKDDDDKDKDIAVKLKLADEANFNDNEDYFQSLMTDNIGEVMHLHDIDLRQEGTGESAPNLNDNGDYFQSLMTDNICPVKPVHDIDFREGTGESALNFYDNEEYFERLTTDNIREVKPLHDIDVRQEGTGESAPSDNSILTQRWDYYSGPFEDLASLEDGMSHSNPFGLSYIDNLDDWRPPDFSYQFDSSSLLDYFFPGMGFILE